MRIVCPNCAARYEIDADAVPQGGRDLQCSACGHIWFFTPPTGPGAGTPIILRQPAAQQDDVPPQAPEDTPPPESPRPPPVDPAVLAVLRAEAEREARARRAEEATLFEPATPPGEGPEAPRRRLPPAPAIVDSAAPGPKRRPGRERLPAVEHIDPAQPEAPAAAEPATDAPPPSPPPAADAPDGPAEAPAPSRSGLGRGFWLGFSAVLGLGLVLLALYFHARTASAPPQWLLAFADALDGAGNTLGDAWEQLGREMRALLAGR